MLGATAWSFWRAWRRRFPVSVSLRALTKETYDSLSDVPIWNPVRFKPDICPYHWSDVLPYLEKELAQVKAEPR